MEKKVIEVLTQLSEKSWDYIFKSGMILGFTKAAEIVKDANNIDSAVFLLTGLAESLKCDLNNKSTKKEEETQKDGEEK